jgi:tetratricopeptide (TPR) repeat protein
MSYHHAQPQSKPRLRRKRHPGDETTSTTSPQQPAVQHIMHLQRTIGNKATLALLQRSPEIAGKQPELQRAVGAEQADFMQAWQGAVKLSQGGDYLEAVGMFFSIEQNYELDAGIRAKLFYNVGMCYMKVKEPDNALRYFEKALEVRGAPARIFDLALRMTVLAREQVKQQFTPQHFMDEGLLRYGDGDFQQALEEFNRGLTLFKEIPPLLKIKMTMNVGICHYRLKNYKSAKEYVLAGLKLDGVPAEIHAFGRHILKKIAKKTGGNSASGGKKKPFIF